MFILFCSKFHILFLYICNLKVVQHLVHIKMCVQNIETHKMKNDSAYSKVL